MRTPTTLALVACILLGAARTPAIAQVFSSEFCSDPVTEGWDLWVQYCEPETSNIDGWYHQRLDHHACPASPDGAADVYRRSLVPVNGVATFFLEFRVQTDGDGSEIPGGRLRFLSWPTMPASSIT